jgi:hypothetical protein
LLYLIKVFIIYHSLIHPIHTSIILLYLPSPHSWNSFNRSHFFICVCVCVCVCVCISAIFTLLHLSSFLINSPLTLVSTFQIGPVLPSHSSFYKKIESYQRHLLRWSSGFCLCFYFASINVLYYFYRFVYVEPPLHPWDEADLVMVNDLSNMLLDSVCHYFIEDFCIDVH